MASALDGSVRISMRRRMWEASDVNPVIHVTRSDIGDPPGTDVVSVDTKGVLGVEVDVVSPANRVHECFKGVTH